MAFNQQQAKRTQAVVVIAVLVLVIVLAVVVLSGGTGPAAPAPAAPEGSASVGQQATAGDAASQNGGAGTQANGGADASAPADAHTDASGMELKSMADVDATYGAAEQSLQHAYDKDPANPVALLNLANGYFDWGSAAMHYAASAEDEAHVRELFSQAITLYDRYLEQNPQSNSVIVDRAICVFYTGDHARAIQLLEDFTSTNAEFAPAWANLGTFYEAAGQKDKARKAYEHAVETAGEAEASVKTFAQQHLESLG